MRIIQQLLPLLDAGVQENVPRSLVGAEFGQLVVDFVLDARVLVVVGVGAGYTSSLKEVNTAEQWSIADRS
jgi:hypothetical protein